MGSATRDALAASRAALGALGSQGSLTVGEDLFAAGRAIGDSAQLRSALADPAAAGTAKSSVVEAVFSRLSAGARALLVEVAQSRWSSEDDLLAGIEELGLRVVAQTATAATPIEAELFAFLATVSSNADLELAVGSKLGSTESKAALITTLVGQKVSQQTLTILSHLVQQPRGRRIAELVRTAARVVADEAGLSIATVTSASALSAGQLDRLGTSRAHSYGRELRLNHVVDPAVIGGLRVQIGDDVIDGSIASRLKELRLQLAG